MIPYIKAVWAAVVAGFETFCGNVAVYGLSRRTISDVSLASVGAFNAARYPE